jgi:catechol 2,3-dioxygenase-like lactoylglutathione lyase family enzyme
MAAQGRLGTLTKEEKGLAIGVSDLERSKAFYDKALKAIGIERLYSEGAEFFGYEAHKKAFFWIGLKPSAITGVHVAFAAPDRAAVDRFYAAAVGAGGCDNGKPGLRPLRRGICPGSGRPQH